MATTNIHHSPTSRAYERRSDAVRTEERSSYAAVWVIIAFAVIAAIAYGYFTSESTLEETSMMPMVQTTPTTDGTSSSVIGTGPASNDLNPPSVEPGTPDTTMTQRNVAPAESVE